MVGRRLRRASARPEARLRARVPEEAITMGATIGLSGPIVKGPAAVPMGSGAKDQWRAILPGMVTARTESLR